MLKKLCWLFLLNKEQDGKEECCKPEAMAQGCYKTLCKARPVLSYSEQHIGVIECLCCN